MFFTPTKVSLWPRLGKWQRCVPGWWHGTTSRRGGVLDCACGSGIQLAAYGTALQRPLLGVELDEGRARASAVNVRSVVEHTRSSDTTWYRSSRIVAGDGTDAGAC